MTVASKMIPAARPIANCLMSGPGPVESEKNANMRTSAALVTSLPVRARPSSIAFGVSAVAAFYVPTTGDVVNTRLVNLGTAVGGVCFLVGAVLLLPERTRTTATSPSNSTSTEPAVVPATATQPTKEG